MRSAADLMTVAAVTLPVTANVRDALWALSRTVCRHVPLVAADGKLLGMISDHALDDLWSAPGPVDDAWLTQLRGLLDSSLEQRVDKEMVAVAEEMDLIELTSLIVEHRVGALPVVDPEGRLLGVVSSAEVLDQLSTMVPEPN